MAFFGSSSNSEETHTSRESSSISAAMITQCITITGNIKGCGTLHIDGVVEGDVEIEEKIVLGKSGKIHGNLTSKTITVSGEVNGRIFGEQVTVTESGTVSNDIHAHELTVDGRVQGYVQVEEKLHVEANGTIHSEKLESKHIVVNGAIEGNVTATEILEVNTNGKVTGEMTVKTIKVAEGGMMLGSMQTYQPDAAKSGTAQPAVSPYARPNDAEESTVPDQDSEA